MPLQPLKVSTSASIVNINFTRGTYYCMDFLKKYFTFIASSLIYVLKIDEEYCFIQFLQFTVLSIFEEFICMKDQSCKS